MIGQNNLVENQPVSNELAAAMAAPDDIVECVVAKLNGICRSATLAFALRVGELIITTFYAGDLSRWRSRDRVKDISLRKLAKHPDLPMSVGALYRSIAIYELSQRLKIRSWKHVSTGHMRLVLPLSPDEQVELLRIAEAERWSVRRLDAEIAATSARGPLSRAGRGGQRRSRLRRVAREVEHCVGAVRRTIALHEARTSDPSPESTRAAIDALRSAVETCMALELRLVESLPEARVDGPSSRPKPVALADDVCDMHQTYVAKAGTPART